MKDCPCTSDKSFEECCEPYLSGISTPPTPEQLMRSRYTAYTVGNIDYVMSTMKGKVLAEFDKEEAIRWANNSDWEKLVSIDAPNVAEDAKEGVVEFVAHYSVKGESHEFHERSHFIKEKGRWFYTDGFVDSHDPVRVEKIGRNDPCPCGSGKKYKKCCGK